MTVQTRLLSVLILLVAVGCSSKPAPPQVPQSDQSQVDLSASALAADEALMVIKVMGSCYD